MKNLRYANQGGGFVDYHLNLLGVRVFEDACQLVARSEQGWVSIGPKCDLPIEIPKDTQELIGTDSLKLTAWQYAQEHPCSDIREVLSRRKSFELALSADAE